MNQNDAQYFQRGCTKALKDVKKELNLPETGEVIFPLFYLSKKCYHLSNSLNREYKKLIQIYALLGFAICGPHTYFFFKSASHELINLVFLGQIILFIAFVVYRNKVLKKAEKYQLDKAPIFAYTKFVNEYISKDKLLKLLLWSSVLLLVASGFSAFSALKYEMYLMFIFFIACFLWFLSLWLICLLAYLATPLSEEN